MLSLLLVRRAGSGSGVLLFVAGLRGRPFTLSPGFLPLGSRLVTFFAAHSVSVGAFHSVSVRSCDVLSIERRRGNGIVDVATRFGC